MTRRFRTCQRPSTSIPTGPSCTGIAAKPRQRTRTPPWPRPTWTRRSNSIRRWPNESERLTVQGSREDVMSRLDALDEKGQAELRYWRAARDKEGTLANGWYEHF